MYLQVAVNIHIYQPLEYATPDEITDDHNSADNNTLGLIFSDPPPLPVRRSNALKT